MCAPTKHTQNAFNTDIPCCICNPYLPCTRTNGIFTGQWEIKSKQSQGLLLLIPSNTAALFYRPLLTLRSIHTHIHAEWEGIPLLLFFCSLDDSQPRLYIFAPRVRGRNAVGLLFPERIKQICPGSRRRGDFGKVFLLLLPPWSCWVCSVGTISLLGCVGARILKDVLLFLVFVWKDEVWMVVVKCCRGAWISSELIIMLL